MLSKKSLLQHLACIVIIVILNIAYFFPQMEGKVVRQVDIISSSQSTAALKDYKEQHGRTFLWNPAQYGGMPILAGAPSNSNVVYYAYSVLKMGFKEPMGLFIAGSLLAYLMFVLLGLNPWLSMIFGVSAVFATGNLILWEAGHNSKIRTLIFTPLLIAGVLYIFEKRKYFPGFLLLSLGFAFSFFTRHPQMTYYILLVFMIYGLVVLFQTVRSKEWIPFLKGTAFVVAALVLGMCTSATKIWSLYDYSKSTMRGGAILTSPSPSGSTNSSGLDWDYAMQWSNDYKDVMATFIPGFVGGGGSEKVSTKSQSFKKYRIKNAPLYWGQLPFTVGPLYMGSSLIFFFIVGLFYVKGNLKWWLGIGAVWMIMLSMGRNLEILNYPIYQYFPFYSKFRAPQTVLNVAPWFVTLMAGFGAWALVNAKMKKTKKKKKETISLRPLLISGSIAGGMALLFAVLGTSFFDFSSIVDAQYAQQGADPGVFISDRKALFRGDAWRSFFIVAILLGLCYAYLKDKISKSILIAGIGLITIFDLFNVGWRYLDHSKYVRQREYMASFEPRPVDQQIATIEKDRSRYRVQDMTIDTYNSSETSAHHNTVGGYSAVKMQRIQDLRERHFNRNNMKVYNMLNTKYFIIADEGGQPQAQRNGGALGNAWFVNNIQTAGTPDEEIDALNVIEPSTTAVVLAEEFGGYIDDIASGDRTGSTVELINYAPDDLTYKTRSNQGGLVVFSEMWYQPGWQAYLNGEPVDHIRANYALRAIKVPTGEHEVRFEFRPRSYYMGEKVSLGSSLLLVGLCLFGVWKSFRPLTQ